MVNSNARKLCLSGWLMNNGFHEYNSPLKLQKFLLFYESFTKIEGEKADFSSLKGYKCGPVFSNVWEDYTKERASFDDAAQKKYLSQNSTVDIERAKKSLFLVSIMSEYELSLLTHKFNLWKSKESRIMSGEYQVELSESDFNEDDSHIMMMLNSMYPISLIDNSHIIKIDNHYFVFNKRDIPDLTEQHLDALSILSDNSSLNNPVFIEIDEEGRLIVD